MEKMKLPEIFSQAAKLVEKGWIQHQVAIDDRGEVCLPTNPNATGWCLVGALIAATGSIPEFLAVEQRLEEHFGCQDGNVLDRVIAFNDSEKRTRAEVIDFLRAFAINLANNKE